MSDNVRLLVDGHMIKAAREPGGAHSRALRVLRPGQPEQRSWGATISGELRVFRSQKEDEFEIEVQGDITFGCPEPDFSEGMAHKAHLRPAKPTTKISHCPSRSLQLHIVVPPRHQGHRLFRDRLRSARQGLPRRCAAVDSDARKGRQRR
jgi:hypothetical protein